MSKLGPDALAPGKATSTGDAATAAAYGAFLAAVMAHGCHFGRLFSAAEIDKAVDVGCTLHGTPVPSEHTADGVPVGIAEAAEALGSIASRAHIHRGLCAALPASLVAAEGTA